MITVGPAVTSGAGWLLHIVVHFHPVLGVSLYERTGHFVGSVPKMYLPSLGRIVNLRDLAGQVLREGAEWLQGQPGRIQDESDKRQAVYDRVLRDGRRKSVAEVRELLEYDWRV